MRFEGLELARERDRKAMEAWRDHPYVDIIDNRSNFDVKINKLIDLVVKRIGINVGDRYIICSFPGVYMAGSTMGVTVGGGINSNTAFS